VAADGSRPVSAAQMRRVAEDPGRLDLVGAPEGFDALVMADIVRARKGLSVFVARDAARLSAFVDAFRFFAQQVEVLTFPAWDCLPYDRVGPSAGVGGPADGDALAAGCEGIDEKKPVLLVTSVPAVIQRVPPKAAIHASYSARAGNSVDIADLERLFRVNGYSRASTVSERGEFAIRGGVIDVFPPSAEEPVRLDLFGDTLESIRAFDPETQRSTKQLKEVSLLPVSEALLDKAAISRFRTGYLEAFGAPGDDPLYATVSEGGRRAGWSTSCRCSTTDGDPVRLPAEGRPGGAGPPGPRGARRAAGDGRPTPTRPAPPPSAGAYHPLEPERLYLTTRSGTRLLASGRPAVLAVQRGRGRGGHRHGRQAGPQLLRRAGKQDSVNLFEATAATPRSSPATASGCCSPPGRTARPSGWDTCWPTTG
jgi:transcription-repair coupling factor (superfamily II helicase)